MLEKITLFLLVVAFIAPIWVSRHFYDTNALGMSQFYMFIAESFAMAVTLSFALFHYTGNAHMIAVDAQWWMRASMALGGILSTLRASYVVRMVLNNEGS